MNKNKNRDRIYSEDINPISLSEERRRTGRYVAVALAICITLLGLYQSMVQHTPVVAGLFAPAIIMFLYVFWVLYTASKAPKYHIPPSEDNEDEVEQVEQVEQGCRECKRVMELQEQENLLTEVIVNHPSTSDKAPILPKEVNVLKENNILAEKFTRSNLNRTYSIA